VVVEVVAMRVMEEDQEALVVEDQSDRLGHPIPEVVGEEVLPTVQ
jgi:hypothetical protein